MMVIGNIYLPPFLPKQLLPLFYLKFSCLNNMCTSFRIATYSPPKPPSPLPLPITLSLHRIPQLQQHIINPPRRRPRSPPRRRRPRQHRKNPNRRNLPPQHITMIHHQPHNPHPMPRPQQRLPIIRTHIIHLPRPREIQLVRLRDLDVFHDFARGGRDDVFVEDVAELAGGVGVAGDGGPVLPDYVGPAV